jgi:asparagine synthase (glutamine-hydrolysing)
MCGFVGFLSRDIGGSVIAERRAEQMASAINYRGPDDSGVWSDPNAGVVLAHKRLSILDISDAGHQPMESRSSRYVLVFNGEIYNHIDLRSQLESLVNSSAIKLNGYSAPIQWSGHSDTETILCGFEHWGIEETVKRCVGMFSFALWDKKSSLLTLGRDRVGEKPIYYGWQGDVASRTFLFASELTALKSHPSFLAKINRDAICLLMRYGYIAAPHSIYEGIFKLEPGHLLTVSLSQVEPIIASYWSIFNVIKDGIDKPFLGTPYSAVAQLEVLLKSAVSKQMIADVPIGAFLSGGVDSSTVVALMQNQSSIPIKTFTIGFNETGFDEAIHAKTVAKYLGTDHTELYISPKDALDVIPLLPTVYCEPFADSSQIPTILVSQLAKQKVTVSLSGDGGDELFCGYNRYLAMHKFWKKLSILPIASRRILAQAILAISPGRWNVLLGPAQKLLLGNSKQVNMGDKLHKGAGVLASESSINFYLGLLSNWSNPAELVIGGQEPSSVFNSQDHNFYGLNDIDRMMALDITTFLPDDILAKVDRAAMSVSLEGRMPLLDHKVVEFAWSLPQDYKLRNGLGKWVLREVLYKYVPKDLIERPKMGFGVPIGQWLRGPLKSWAEELLNESRLLREGYFYPAPIRKKWEEHLSGARNWEYQLWNVLMFQAWLEQQ